MWNIYSTYIIHEFLYLFYNSNQFEIKHDRILKKFIKDKFKIEYFVVLIGIN